MRINELNKMNEKQIIYFEKLKYQIIKPILKALEYFNEVKLSKKDHKFLIKIARANYVRKYTVSNLLKIVNNVLKRVNKRKFSNQPRLYTKNKDQ